MSRSAQLQFAAMAPEAQRAAIRRLALRGLDDEEIAGLTGLSLGHIRRVLSQPDEMAPSPVAIFKSRRSGSTGGPAQP